MLTEETLKGNPAYERVAKHHEAKIRAYHTDNLRFNDKYFIYDCDNVDQTYTYYGVGSHRHNTLMKWLEVIKFSL